MSANPFTHLHVHSEYSLLDGSAKIKELIARAMELGMDSVAITDHGVMYGVIDFYKEAVANGIKPIIGCEVYVASGSRFNRENGRDNFYYHLVLLAENNEGYHNLVKLVSAGFTEGFYYKPRIDLALLREHSQGLIGLSACLSGPVAKTLLTAGYEKAHEQALLYEDILGKGNFYLEIQDHGLADQQTVNRQILKMSAETGIPLVCTNDSHYIYREDARAHEILLCIQTGKTMHDEDRMKYEGDQFYFKSMEEMGALFSYAPEAVENTVKIAERCQVSFTFNEYKLPRFQLPEGREAFEYLRELCYEGLNFRYGEKADGLRERLDYELETIRSMGFVDYFLIVWDFIKYSRDHGIMVGPGRGSSAGSIVTYCLRVTNIDPIKYDLLFERFLNPERISMPDIDIDFCYERRQEVIDYVVSKYGADHVAQIVTFGTMAARLAIRDVGRAMGMPYADVDRVAKMIPFELGITIKRALELNPELHKAYEGEEDTQELINMSMRLEGLPRHSSTHAAGVVICDRPVTDYVPVGQNDEAVVTQFPMNTLEELGLLKMDFLGLRTLTVIQNAVKEIKRGHGVDIDTDRLDYEDPKVFELISQAKTEGIFQLESAGMKSFMKELQPTCLEDIIAGISLYRPGPMDFIPKYIKGKNGGADVEYTHESLRPILNATYGCIVYQEQVMQIVRDLAGYSLGRSDLVRRAMSKKKTAVMAQERKIFIYGLGDDVPGCIRNGIPEATANRIFDEMTDFAKYAFVKSHAAAYAVIGYQTAWLKIYYPVEFMAATMTSVIDFTSKVAEYIDECKKLGIRLLPPDINESYAHFSVRGKDLRFGLLAVKNVGRAAIEAMVREREANGSFKSMTEFIRRMENGELNKRCVESLIKGGAFDSLGGKRSQYMYSYKQILDGVSQSKKRNIEGQLNLFDMSGGEEELFADDLPNIKEYDQKSLLSFEKEVLGIYVSGHPLSQYESAIKRYADTTSLDFIYNENTPLSLHDGMTVSYGGIIVAKSIKYTKNNKAMAFLTVEDMYGTVEVIVFSQAYEKYLGRLEPDRVVVVSGRVSVKEEEDAKIICNTIMFYEDMENAGVLWLKIPRGVAFDQGGLTKLLSGYRGDMPVCLYDEEKKQKLRLNEMYWVHPENGLIAELKSKLGEGSVVIKER